MNKIKKQEPILPEACFSEEVPVFTEFFLVFLLFIVIYFEFNSSVVIPFESQLNFSFPLLLSLSP